MQVPQVLQDLGHNPEPILARAGLKPEQFEDPDTVIPYLVAGKLLADCATTTGCRHFGLLVGERAGPSTLGLAGFILASAPNVGTALHDLLLNLDLHDQGGVPTLFTNDSTTYLGYSIHLSGAEATDQIHDLAIAVACNIMRGLCGKTWNPAEVFFPYRQPLDLDPYRRFFRGPLHFNADHCALAFPSHWLKHQIPTADPLLHRHLEQEAAELHDLRNPDMMNNLRGLLVKSLQVRHCSAADVARQLNMHQRTLNRRLHEKGTSFRNELESVRFEMAQQLLADSTMPIARIAKALNYADVSAFSRAFKRWAGTTPAEWRNHNVTARDA